MNERVGNLEEKQLQERTSGPRLYQLDALRGIAAVLVVAHHLRLTGHTWQIGWAAVPFFSGAQAVDLFFVLSGFVLSLPFWRGRTLIYSTYVMRRFIRIYLPFAAAAALALCGAWFFQNHDLPAYPFFDGIWHTNITPGLVIAQALMWPMPTFNGTFWSLRYEMQLSILMPFLVWLLRRQPIGVLLMSLGLGFGSIGLITKLDQYHLIGSTLQIGSLFALGAVLAKKEAVLRSGLRRLRGGAWGFFAASLFLYFDYPIRLPLGHLQGWLDDRHTLLSGLGAAGIILCSLEMDLLRRALAGRVPEYLGRISYSLYLVHSTIVVALFCLLYGVVPTPVLYLVAILGSWAGAHLFCRWVEEPTIRLGKRVHWNLRSMAFTSLPD